MFSSINSATFNVDNILASLNQELATIDKLEADLNAQYTDYYDRATKGNTKDIPSEALQNMASDPTCSSAAFQNISRELQSRGEQVDPDAAAIQDTLALYARYYADASAGDVGKTPTKALQNMASDPNCSKNAYDHIVKELEARGEPITPDDDVNSLYAKYYEMASNNRVATIPTEALQNMAMDPACSATAFGYIADELDYREEPIDRSFSADW